MNSSRNIAARAGRWSARHRKTAIFGWIALVVAAVMIGSAIGTETLAEEEYGVGESGQADQILADAFPKQTSEVVLIQSDDATAASAEFRSVVDETTQELRGVDGVREIESPYDSKDGGGISEDGHSALINFELPRSDDASADAAAGDPGGGRGRRGGEPVVLRRRVRRRERQRADRRRLRGGLPAR